MAPPSWRAVGPPRGLPRLNRPSPCSPDADGSNDATLSLTALLPEPPERLQSRLEAVDRNRFEVYGRQHAHVDHISGTEMDKTIVLQSTMLLQEDGLLSSRLDDVSYILGGLLTPPGTPRARLAQAHSVLELVQLLQDPQILQAVELSSRRRRIQDRIKQLLLSRLPSGDDADAGQETYRLSLAVLVFLLSGSGEIKEVFDRTVLDVVVHALKRELVQEGQKKEQKEDTLESKAAEVLGGSGAVLKKTCLIRKQVSARMDEKRLQNGEGNTGHQPLAASTLRLLDECCWTLMDELLQAHEIFYVEGKLQISTADMLCAALHNLLQVDCSTSSSSSGVNLAQEHHQRQSAGDAAGNAFQLICARKRHLVRSGGIELLVHGLAKRTKALEAVLPSSVDDPVTLECARSLHGVMMLLRVFNQVTFLMMDVQQYLSKERVLFSLLLKLIRLLTEMSWTSQVLKRWKAESIRMMLGVDVLMSALRVLINLTHHNDEAASHLYALGGMPLLAHSFSQLWSQVETLARAEQRVQRTVGQEKWSFDATLLLLSAMVNSVEFSDENRDALARTPFLARELRGDTASSSAQGRSLACDLFIKFFRAKLRSYEHFIEMTEDRAGRGTISIEEKRDDWNPEDIILGGCTALLLGYLIKGSTVNRAEILKSMPGGSPRLLLRALGVFVAFHSQVGALTPEVATSVLQIEKVLKSCQGRELGVDQCNLLTNASVSTLPVAGGQQRAIVDKLPPANSAEVDLDQLLAMSTEDVSREKVGAALQPPIRARQLRNMCSNIDDSDEDDEPHVEDRVTKVLSNEHDRPKSESLQVMRTSTRTPPRSPGMKRLGVKSPFKTPPAPRASSKSPLRGSQSRDSLTAVFSDGRLSSPVVARLLKRTRELVDEFDADFARPSRSSPDKKSGYSNNGGPGVDNVSSPCVVLTMDVTCRDNGSGGLDLSQDMGEENCRSVSANNVDGKQSFRSGSLSKRRKKPARNPDANTKSAAVYQETLFDSIPTSTPPSTPLRKTKTKMLLQTPTRNGCSPRLCRESPSFNLTPTKTPPSMPLRMKKSAGLLRTTRKNDRSPTMNRSPMLTSPHRRKLKAPHVAPSAQCSSIFDFME